MKKNPRKIPKTQIDVDRAYMEGWEKCARDFLDLMIYTLGCDCDMGDEWLDFFHERFVKNLDCYQHGELTIRDMRQAAKDEKGWTVELV